MNARHTWTAREDAELLRMADAGVPCAERAAHFRMTSRAVAWHLTQLRAARRMCAARVTRVDEPRPGGGSRFTYPAEPEIPIDIEEPTALDDYVARNQSDRVGNVAAGDDSIANGDKSTRSEWSVGGASRERLLARQLAELRSQHAKLLDELNQRDEQLNVARALASVVKPIVGKPRSRGGKRHGTPVLMCSDWHIEELVRPETVNGLNEYNLEIAEECIERMADAFEWMLQDSRYDCREGVVWLGGDLFSGFIHEELAEQNQLAPVEAVVWLHQHLLQFFTRILAETNLERIVVVCNDGNHGRLTHRMRVSTRTSNSLEWLLYQQLARHFANEPRLQFQIADGISNYLQIYDTTICFQHGDTFKYMGGVGGLLIPVRRGLNELRKYRHLDHLVMGHFHSRLDAGDVIVNGSAIGITPYGMSIKATPEPRQQSWFLVDQERGKCLSAPVWLPTSV